VFETSEDIVRYFVDFRLSYYEKRKARLLKDLTEELDVLTARMQFIDAVIRGRIVVANEKKPDLLKSIEAEGIPKVDGSHDFLLSMPIWSLTFEKFIELQKKVEQKRKEKEKVEKTKPADFYRQDLKDLRSQVEKSHAR